MSSIKSEYSHFEGKLMHCHSQKTSSIDPQYVDWPWKLIEISQVLYTVTVLPVSLYIFQTAVDQYSTLLIGNGGWAFHLQGTQIASTLIPHSTTNKTGSGATGESVSCSRALWYGHKGQESNHNLLGGRRPLRHWAMSPHTRPFKAPRQFLHHCTSKVEWHYATGHFKLSASSALLSFEKLRN